MYNAVSLKNKISSGMAKKVKLIKSNRIRYLFMLPYAVLFTTFVIFPVAIAMFYSLTSFNILEPPRFIGFQNYFRLLFQDDIFIIAIRNTIIFAVITGPLGYLIALMFAWMINDLTKWLRVTLTVIFYAPSISGGMVIIWNYLFNGDAKGFINAQLIRFGAIDLPINFLQDPRYLVSVLIVIILWMSLGPTFLSFIAGLQGIDKQYYEAGAVDGISNRWQELWFITLPMMRPQLMFGAVMNITATFAIGDIITQIVGFPSPEYSAHTIMNHLFDYGTIRYEMGYACAIATILFAVMLTVNKFVQKLLRKVGE